jgi:hypothetical protein
MNPADEIHKPADDLAAAPPLPVPEGRILEILLADPVLNAPAVAGKGSYHD